MIIDWVNFSPWSAVLGGMLIGIATALFIFFNGRIAGISGIVGGLFRPKNKDLLWRLAFLSGLVLSPWMFQLLAPLPSIIIEAHQTTLILAGLLVGIGTQYGSGCTSGHGVCGLSRFSLRSLIATLVFMAMGFITVYLLRHYF